jgi:hypothetical protein
MNSIHKFWRWFTTPHILAEWKWEGNKLTDLPRAAWCAFRRTIRGPILKVLIGDDLVIVGDIYLNNATKGTALIQIPNGKWGEIIGSITTHDGPTAIVPPGCDPR